MNKMDKIHKEAIAYAKHLCDVHAGRETQEVDYMCTSLASDYEAFREGATWMKEQAGTEFCNHQFSVSLRCSLKRKADMSCQNTCSVYKKFMSNL